jgi:hypothetical protein
LQLKIEKENNSQGIGFYVRVKELAAKAIPSIKFSLPAKGKTPVILFANGAVSFCYL